jgi:hypothetical protein
MIEFTVKNIDYKIEEYLTIENYVKIFKVKDLFEDHYLKAKVINLLTDCPMEDLMESENHYIDYLATSIFAMVPRPPFNLIDRFELDGVQYGFLPSYKEITFAEFVDLDTLLTKKSEEIMEMCHIIAAIMYRPIISEKSKHNFRIEKYSQDSLEERAELFKKKLDVRYLLGGQFFFIKFVNNSSNFTRLSLTQRMKLDWMMAKFVVRNWRMILKILLKKDLDGMLSSIELQRMILVDTLKSLKRKS